MTALINCNEYLKNKQLLAITENEPCTPFINAVHSFVTRTQLTILLAANLILTTKIAPHV